MEYKDYYKILGVQKKVNDATIKKAFRKLARKYHPDFNKGNPTAESKFKEVNEAYQVLSDPEKRRKYDQLGSNWNKYKDFSTHQGPFNYTTFRSGAQPGGGFQDFSKGKSSGFSDFFKTFFGGFDLFGGAEDAFSSRHTPRPGARRRTSDMNAEIEISIVEAMKGAHKQLTINRETLCPQCHGKRMISGAPCQTCYGKGVLIQPENIDVKIPAGMQNGSKLRLRGKGGSPPGSAMRGDLYLKVKIRNDTRFRLEGRNIYCEIPITIYEAVLGAEIEIPTVTGKVKMRIPAETENGKTFRLKGKGLPSLGKRDAGDQIAKIKIVLPKNLSAREKKLFHELAGYRTENPRSGS